MIIYSVVARGSTLLAEYTPTSGNFNAITKRILERLPQSDSKMTYTYDRHYFHYWIEDGITYLCMCDEAVPQRIAFAYLEDIKNRFRSAFGDRGKVVPAMAMNAEFASVMQKQMDYFSNDPNADRITRVKSEVEKVQQVMTENIELVLERGERIELLVDKTDHLQTSSLAFKKASTSLKRSMWWKNVKLMIIIGIVLVVVLYFIICIACGGMKWQRCIN